MKKNVLFAMALLACGCSQPARPVSEAPRFIHAAYSVESLLSEAELSGPGYEAFDFVYLMAAPAKWWTLDFDLPEAEIVRRADAFDYASAPGNMPLVPRMIGEVHAAGGKILLCFGGQQEFRPFLEKPERLTKFEAYMVRLVERNDYDGIDMDWEITIDKELHADMMGRLRGRLDSLSAKTGKYYYLTTALSIDHVYDEALAGRLSRAVDWINIMSYDMCDGGLGPHAVA